MANPTSANPKISITEHRTSTDSPRTSLSSQRTTSDSSVSLPNHVHTTHSRDSESSEAPSSSSSSQQECPETMTDMERERKQRKRDYALEISRIMGQQLVKGMNKNKDKGEKREDEDVR